MRFKNESQYPTDEVRSLITFAVRGIDLAHVGVLVYDTHKYISCEGAAYYGVPKDKAFYGLQSVVYFIEIGVGSKLAFPRANLIPRERKVRCTRTEIARLARKGIRARRRQRGVVRYHVPYGGMGAPYIIVRNWQEGIICAAAHEAWHIYQIKNGLKLSEHDAEIFASERLAKYRGTLGA